MNPTERDSLLRLISRLIENRISESEFASLNDALRTSEAARRLYAAMMHQEATLQQHAANLSATSARDLRRTKPRRTRWAIPIGLAATLALMAAVVVAIQGIDLRSSDQPALATLRASGEPTVSLLRAGHHRLQRGAFTIDFFSGAQLQMEGPASFWIHDGMHIEVERGAMVANVTDDARGFRISSPGTSFVDLGTEFALNIEPETAQLKVFRGQVLANTTNPKGSTERSRLVEPGPALRYDGAQGRYHAMAETEEGFSTFRFESTPPLPDLSAFRESIQLANPEYYWDFEQLDEGGFRDHQQDRVLRTHGTQVLPSSNGFNQAVRFLPSETFHLVELEGALQFEKDQPFAIEFLFCSDQLRRSTLLAIFDRDSVTDTGSSDHFILIETMSRQDVFSHTPGALRSTYRPKPSANAMDGINAFTRSQVLPGTWNHFVLSFDGKTLRSYLNGRLETRIELLQDEASQAGHYALVLGQTAWFEVPHVPSGTYRPFVGSIDELALFNRALSDVEIRERFALLPH